MLEVVQADYAKLESTTAAQEAAAAKDFTQLTADMARGVTDQTERGRGRSWFLFFWGEAKTSNMCLCVTILRGGVLNLRQNCPIYMSCFHPCCGYIPHAATTQC